MEKLKVAVELWQANNIQACSGVLTVDFIYTRKLLTGLMLHRRKKCFMEGLQKRPNSWLQTTWSNWDKVKINDII
jgi:hypothetical protein